MIVSTRRSQILICKEPTDMRLGFDGLNKRAKRAFGQNPYNGQYFVFVNRRRTSCKVYTWDGSGDVLISKRLSQGGFCRPNPSYKKQIRMTSSEFLQFFEGLNISGRILESNKDSRPTKKLLRFIPPYRRLNTSNATRINNTGEGQPATRSE
jgi:transposase